MPFKGFGLSKRRLAPLLSADERSQLAGAMVADVLTALRCARGFERVLLVSADPAALALAAGLGVGSLAERTRSGYRAAATETARWAGQAGADGLLIVPADLPLATAADFEALAEAARQAEVVLVASATDGGTNALLTCPPGAIPYLFGLDSFQQHLRAAERRGLRTSVLSPRRLLLDVDEPADLRRLVQSGELPEGGTAARFLASLDLDARFAALASPSGRGGGSPPDGR